MHALSRTFTFFIPCPIKYSREFGRSKQEELLSYFLLFGPSQALDMASPFSADWMIYALPWLMRANNSADWSFFWGMVCIIGVFGGVLRWVSPGGWAWAGYGTKNPIPGPRGWPIIGSLAEMGVDAHRRLKDLAVKHNALDLMAVSLGSTRLVISSKPEVAKELLSSSAFADRPLKQSAQQLLFGRAIGFAPYGEYWRNLRRIASNNLFSPKRIFSHAPLREMETARMVQEIFSSSKHDEALYVRPFLQRASLNNIMSSVFGRKYNFGSDCSQAHDLQNMVREGFELLGAFNWADHLSFLQSIDPHNIHGRCQVLVPKVTSFVQKIIDEHRARSKSDAQDSDFVDVLLSLKGDEKLQDADMVAVLWEMIFRGTDTTAILTEWIMAEIVLHPEVQNRLHKELDMVVGKDRPVQESDIPNLHYMQAVVKESLRMHPPGPLLSWARLAIHDTEIAGHFIPAGTTAMVNMYSITHDPEEWKDPDNFNPSRFMAEEGGMDVDIKGTNLKLAPFGAGRRVCPGRMLGLATVHLWLARLMHEFQWLPHDDHPVNLSEVLKLSCEMQYPLCAKAIPRLSTKV